MMMGKFSYHTHTVDFGSFGIVRVGSHAGEVLKSRVLRTIPTR